MFSLLALGWAHYAFSIPLSLISVFLMLVILVQRGRGGGLTGALGGMGGQSAFGTKAGDLFTRITIVVAALWILLSMAALKILNQQSATAGVDPNKKAPITAPATPGSTRPGSATPSPLTPAPATPPAGTSTTPPETTPPATPAPASTTPTTPAPAPSPAPATPAPAPAEGTPAKPASP